MAGISSSNSSTVGTTFPAIAGILESKAPPRGTPFSELVRSTQRTLFDALDHQATSLGVIVQALDVPRDPSRLPLVEVIFNYSSYFSDITMVGCRVSVLSL